MIVAQVEAVAGKATDKMLEYGGLGVVVLILFVVLIFIFYLCAKYMIPSLMEKFAADQKWFQEEIRRQSLDAAVREAKLYEAFELRFREQSGAFLETLRESHKRFSEDLAEVRDQGRGNLTRIEERITSIHMAITKGMPPPV